jgi:hypothetical protein
MDVRRRAGRNVLRLRTRKSLTPEELAELSGVSQKCISGPKKGNGSGLRTISGTWREPSRMVEA